ncbi:MAG: hypothetical protein IH571_01875, partial [Acholeplasmataceae bacterium]|nr:hypothetical protein [Acholeplasmataceae bacterium]
MSKKIGLNFDWYFSKFSPIHLKNLNIQGWELVHLPHNAVDLPFNHFDEKMTEGLFSYVKTIELKKEWKDKSVFLRFEGVAHRCEIYLNNKLVMEHKGGYTPFEVYLNDVAQFDNLNTLLVVVDTQEHSSIPPFGGVVDFLGYGGIYREAFLLVHEKEHIKNIYVKVDPPLQFNSIKLIVHLTHKKGYLDISIKNNDLIEVIAQRSIVFEHVMGIKIDVPYKVLWSLKNPYLYTVDVAYYI